jgi:DNA-binding CsgD family transcriptional regulator
VSGELADRLMLRACPTCGGTGEVGMLSRRQADVLVSYARLGDQQSVAQALDMSVQTVKNHLGEAYRRLGVGSIVEAIYVLWLRQHFGDQSSGA